MLNIASSRDWQVGRLTHMQHSSSQIILIGVEVSMKSKGPELRLSGSSRSTSLLGHTQKKWGCCCTGTALPFPLQYMNVTLF